MGAAQSQVTVDAATGNVLARLDDGSVKTYNAGDISWVMTSASLVALMTFGVGFLYSGLLRRKNALSMLWLSLAAFGVVIVQWFLIGFSLAFSPTGSAFIGDLKHFGFMGVSWQPDPTFGKVPLITYALYQATFAAITPIIAIGAVGERGRLGPTLVFVFVWSTLVYDVVAAWSWSEHGWANKFGVLDFAGGGVVHMTSGTAAMAYSYWLGKRKGYGTAELAHRPNSVANCILGTVLLICGWPGFNGGSALSANLRASMASWVTWLAAMSAGLTWVVMDLRFERKWSSISYCTGVLTGLIAITPASGFVGAPAALGIGIIAAIASNLATVLKFYLRFDDNLDVFATHAVGGFVGNLLTGIFADKNIAALDGITQIAGGAINGNPVQIAKQLAYSGAIFGYTFAVSSIILLVMDHLPWLTLRVSAAGESAGLDEFSMGEFIVDLAGDAVKIDVTAPAPEYTAKAVLPPPASTPQRPDPFRQPAPTRIAAPSPLPVRTAGREKQRSSADMTLSLSQAVTSAYSWRDGGSTP